MFKIETRQMFRFQDSWVVERTMFEFVNQGGCACCGMSHGSSKDLMSLCSDWETDDGKKERKSIWPTAMLDEVWSERVRFRRTLKEGLSEYSKRFCTAEGGEFYEWLITLSAKDKKKVFQMPKEEILSTINVTFKFKPAYQVVLCAVIEQVANYFETGYTEDGGTDAEVTFEACLEFEKGAFILNAEYYNDEDGLRLLFERFKELGGLHLLPRRTKERKDKVKEEEDEKSDNVTQSFRSDRRLVRLLIARYYADVAWRKFKREKEENKKPEPNFLQQGNLE